MKKHFPHISSFILTLALVFVMSGFVFPQIAHAIPCERVDRRGMAYPPGCEGTAANFEVSTKAGPDSSNDPGFWAGVVETAVAWVISMILKIVSLLTGLAAIVLNGVIYYTVVKVSENYTKITGINEAWKVIRDLSNMAFIFVLLYAAIQTILGIGEDIKKLIVRVIVVAILINFSLFFTKIIIDVSNILALLFYDAIAPGALNATGGFNLTQAGLSNAFMQHLSLTSLYKASENLGVANIITIGVMGSIMLLIAAFVFFAAALMFIIRYVILILVIILSPLAFMGWILPALKKYWEQWWNALSGQAFFAPIYFMLTWIALHVLGGIMTSFGASPGDTTAALGELHLSRDKVNLNPGTFAMLINFIVVIVFLIVSLLIAKEWANKAGPGVSGLTKWAMGAAGGASFGLAGRAGRYTMGAGAEAFKETKAYKRLEAKSAEKSVGGMAARLSLAATDKTRRSSFDVRGGRLGGILAGAGVEAGRSQEGGFEADRKRAEEFLERPGTEAYKKRQERARNAQNELDVMAGVAPGAIPAQITAMENALARMSDKEVEAIVSSNRRLLDSQIFANNISVKQLEALNKSDKFSEAEKDDLKGRRFSSINAGIAAMATPVAARTLAQAAAVAALPIATRNLSDAELEMINPAHLGNAGFVSGLRGAQIDAVNKSSKFTTSQKAALRGARQQPLLSALTTVPASIPAIQTAARGLGAKELIGLMRITGRGGINAAVDLAVLPIYTPQILKRMAPEMDPTTDIPTLRAAIIAGGNPGTIAWLTNPATAGEFA